MANKLNHLAIIMDGNRRYARAQNQLPWLGHKQGIEAARNAIIFCLKKNIKYLSLYTFSLENFNRSVIELEVLFALMENAIMQYQEELIHYGVKIQFVGDRSQFPASLTKVCTNLEQATSQCDKLFVQSLFCYGGQQEIVSAALKLAQDLQDKKIDKESVNQDLFKKYLWQPAIPDPDLIVRPGGIQRLSNFLLYQAAYAELYFTDTNWPAMTEEELEKALTYYNNAKRNFGS